MGIYHEIIGKFSLNISVFILKYIDPKNKSVTNWLMLRARVRGYMVFKPVVEVKEEKGNYEWQEKEDQ